MNTATATTRTLNAALVQDAIRNAGSRSRLAWMAEQIGLSEAALLAPAAQHFGMSALDMVALRRLQPDFALVPFAECQRRNCVVGRMDHAPELTVVLSDPTDVRLRHWLEARLRQRAADAIARGATGAAGTAGEAPQEKARSAQERRNVDVLVADLYGGALAAR